MNDRHARHTRHDHRHDHRHDRKPWGAALRRPWTALAAAAAVVLGPAAVTASALDQANAAPRHHANGPKAEQTQAYLPAETRRRTAA
ncbi:hypothetical protein [Streptomyces sp. CRN 30]|uniref:hypothetical protein n=1 Tax=Streptomyces sp. CRN 30 TaxID=3075613 RepID=UPI002A82568D|nr:hypothetical protein [Streptomyces sp. CRN 30]